MEWELSREEQISRVWDSKPHVVILGAGASIAALPDGDRNGRALPDMRGLASLPAIRTVLTEAGFTQDEVDFEAAYSQMRSAGQTELADRIDATVREYFNGIRITPGPTIYDHLLLALRPKDLVATFNWDPLLVQARHRLVEAGATGLPHLVFLHGNVAVGVCPEHRRFGDVRASCPECHTALQPTPLLYPVTEKNYEHDAFIAQAWSLLRIDLSHACMVTIFGYSAPVTDVAAIREFKSAWGPAEDREFEQFELIDRPDADREALQSRWDDFILSHHFEIFGDFYESAIANQPRRTAEAYVHRFLEAKFLDVNPIPRELDLRGTIAWFGDLRAAEEAADLQHG